MRRKSIFPNSKYYNKLFNALEIFSKHKSLEAKINEKKFSDIPIFEITKKEINNVFILNNCNLINFPIKMNGTKFVENEYIEPFWNENITKKYQAYIMVSKPYILLESQNNVENEIHIIEYKRLIAYLEKKPVKVYVLKKSENFEIIYEE